jgi:beta-N-acetylhexosaminidase
VLDVDSRQLIQAAGPFKAAIANGLDGIMLSHVALPNVTSNREPAMFSPGLTALLREDMGFDGLILTDVLTMRAVTHSFSPSDAAVRAFLSGADVVLVPADVVRPVHAALLKAIRSSDRARQRLDQSLRRILSAKIKRGIIGGAKPRSLSADAVNRLRDIARLVAERAIIVSNGKTRVRLPLDRTTRVGLVTPLDGLAEAFLARRPTADKHIVRVKRESDRTPALQRMAEEMALALLSKEVDVAIVGVLTSADVAALRQLQKASTRVVAIVVGPPSLARDLADVPTVVTHSYRQVSLNAALDGILRN